ncbi:MAG: hypothetical protein H0S85_13540 [Desulfovibrionaceae bacterium]|jgi:hypothetical protein|nr:hypothetical protein [Desulfovibrionaceae bacterium]
MSKTWIRAKRPEFARDVLRDFCMAARELEQRFQEFDSDGLVHFDALRELLGTGNNKGLLWRLKDTAHHLFRNTEGEPDMGRFLDWGVGYIFHETMKLKEDAYQQQRYAPWFRKMQGEEMGDEERAHCEELMQVLFQTRESIEREIKRIRFIVYQCRRMFPAYLATHADNELLARFLFERNELVRSVFRDLYDELIDRIYDGRLDILYVLAARSLRRGGWWEDARRALDAALEANPGCPEAQGELALLAEKAQ